ncbi:MAG: thioredoxin domain-containing protein [Bacteroidales bacterium]
MRITLITGLAVMIAVITGCTSSRPDNTLQDTTKTQEAITAAQQDATGNQAATTSGAQPTATVSEAPADMASKTEQPAKQYPTKPVELNTAEFKKQVFDMDKNPSQWVYNGDLPAIIDFYAVWCGPCKMAAPALEELAKDYAGKVVIYKVDAEKERFLSSYFRVTGYPTFMVVPAKGQPRIFTGLPQGVRTQADIKPAFQRIIESELI